MQYLDAEVVQLTAITQTQGIAIEDTEKQLSALRGANNALLEKFANYVENERKVKTRSWLNGLWQGALSAVTIILALALL